MIWVLGMTCTTLGIFKSGINNPVGFTRFAMKDCVACVVPLCINHIFTKIH